MLGIEWYVIIIGAAFSFLLALLVFVLFTVVLSIFQVFWGKLWGNHDE